MREITARREFWSSHYITACQGPTEIPGPYDDGDVLEIGPGERGLTRPHRGVADICKTVLDKYPDVEERVLLVDYSEVTKLTYDAVHAWYVVHHILPAEFPAFVLFARRSLRAGGVLRFNFARPSDGQTADGMSTTGYDSHQIIRVLTDCGFHIVSIEERAWNNIVVEARL
jgi:hypothetical protein